MTVLLCPLCSQPRFHNLESLRLSLVNAATQSISCPICDDILMGLDKLTIHLFGHTLDQSNELCLRATTTTTTTSLELKTDGGVVVSPKEPDLSQYVTEEKRDDFGEKHGEESRFFNEIDTSYEASKLFGESEAKSDNLCTVNMEDLSFLTSWESSMRQKQEVEAQDPPKAQSRESDLSEYMSDLLNKKLPILNAALAPEKPDDGDEKQAKCDACGFAFQNSILLSMHQELMHSKAKPDAKSPEEEEESRRGAAFIETPKPEEFFPELLHGGSGQSGECVDAVTSTRDCDGGHAACTDAATIDLTLPRYDCHLCSKSFKMKGSLLVHFRVAHFGLQSPDLSVLADRSSPEEKSHRCPICSKSFKKEQHLSQHVKTHEGKQWQCETCSKHFTTKYFLKKHQRLHTGEMPYSCVTCKKTFTFQQSYHKHLLYHSDEKPHQCSQCGRSFKELSTLHNHQRIHSGEKPFACETCGKCFRQRVSYIVHQRIHTGVLPYQCTACKKKFRYKVSQRSHKCTSQPPGIVVRQPDIIVQKILENKRILTAAGTFANAASSGGVANQTTNG